MQLLERHDDLASDGYSSDSAEVMHPNAVDEVDDEPIDEVVQLSVHKSNNNNGGMQLKGSGTKTNVAQIVPAVPAETAFVDHVPRKLCLDIDEPEVKSKYKYI